MLSFFDLNHTAAKDFLRGLPELWQFAPKLKDYLWRLGESLNGDFIQMSRGVWVHEGAAVAKSADIAPPAIIYEGAEVRHCAYIRGGVLVGRGCVVGNSSEVKNSILFDEAKIPHFNYVGDSILGFGAHFGAGVKTANVKADGGEIYITTPRGTINTGLKKLGAFAGDGSETGCNAVLAPAAVIGRGSRVYPLSFVRGYVPPDCILKSGGVLAELERE